ncbi:PQQ-dependent sugar dehydrogenase [Polynucleobacter rarus]|uniref:PQQ-dependent sugar dehydrogenase n=1 Tax=Polynucleobacter rarus TaxID=556055 RepID=UPI001B85BF92|nr:PQQ-dependent sugar dehydrogenase [Polynucleobacter rarus]
MIRKLIPLIALVVVQGALAQTPDAPPPWKQGISEEQTKSTLHPFAPVLTGVDAKDLPISSLKVPAGFKVEVWMEGVTNARSMIQSPQGTVYVSNRNGKNVYAIVEKDGKRVMKTVAKGLDTPNGIAMIDGTLYIAERGRIVKLENIESLLDNPPEPVQVVDGLDPTNGPGHFWKYMVAGPDKKLYFNIGSPQNITLPNYIQAAILRVDPKTGVIERIATGVRNSVGMAFHPVTKKLWFTEHARDWISDDLPNDELNVLNKVGENFGYPFCHQGDLPDPIYGKFGSCSEFTKPVLKLGAHVAPLGLRFYTGKMFPAEYKNNIFVARHGSWNRTSKQGYDVMRIVLDANGKVVKYEPFLTGFLTNDKGDPPMWGRPVDVQVIADGSMLVSDDHNGIIYRISYAK